MHTTVYKHNDRLKLSPTSYYKGKMRDLSGEVSDIKTAVSRNLVRFPFQYTQHTLNALANKGAGKRKAGCSRMYIETKAI